MFDGVESQTVGFPEECGREGVVRCEGVKIRVELRCGVEDASRRED